MLALTHAMVLRRSVCPFCRCSLQGGKCISDASCCGGADDAVFCQRNNPTDKYGTCEVVSSDSHPACRQFGHSPAVFYAPSP